MSNRKKKSSLKSNVISFRLTSTQFKALAEIYKRQPPVHVKSEKRLARKIVCDFVAGRLKYADPKHALVDMEAVAD